MNLAHLYCHRLGIGIVVMAMACSMTVVAEAASHKGSGVFTVSDVIVDVTAKNAAAARVLARAQGHLAAYRRLINRLVPRGLQRDVPKLTAEAVASLVSNFEVDEEKTSTIRYLGKLKFKFERRSVTEFLTNAGIRFAVTRSKPVLVLPVYRSAGVYLLWDKPNPWRVAWAAMGPASGLVPMKHPSGDLADVNDISAEQAVTGDVNRLRVIARRYGTANVLLALAVPSRDRATRRPALQVTVTWFADVGQDRTTVRGFVAKPGESMAELIENAARVMSSQIEEDWKSENLLRFGQEAELLAIIQLSGLQDWVIFARRLADVAFVQNSALVALTRNKATVRLGFLGDERQLTLALAQKDLQLSRSGDSWILRMTGYQNNASANGTESMPSKQSETPR